MSITATTPSTISSATYNLWAIRQLSVSGDGCVPFGSPAGTAAAPVSVTATMVKARILSDGVTWERSPLKTDVVHLSIPNVYAFIATNTSQAQAIAAALASILTGLQDYGSQQGVL